MQTRILKIVLLFILFVLSPPLKAQYWGERVMEKGFEQTDFFFVPSNLLPYGIGSFKNTTPGLLDDPLQNLAVHPAHMRLDSVRYGYLYTDFRSARTIVDQSPNYYVMPWNSYSRVSVDIASRSSYYPWVYLNTRRELEPVFSGAYIFLPFPVMLPNLILGGTYQLMLQDDKYYNVPQDIYRSVIGMDYAGNRMIAESSLPIVDKYSGDDKMNQKGHFMSAFGRYEISSLGSLGMKVGRVFFDRYGIIGSSNLWGGYQTPGNGTSSWSNSESWSQNYDHWELTAGVEYFLNEKTTIGATAGWLWGNAIQKMYHNESSYSNYPSSSYSNYYLSSGNTQQDWRHDGSTRLIGFDVTSRFTAKHTLRLLYQRQRSTVDIGVGTNIIDTSYSTSSYTYLDTLRTSISNYFLRDQRAGSGQQSTTNDRVLASLQWQIDERISLVFGVQFDWQSIEMNTSENVLARMASMYQYSYDNYNYNYGSDQSKDLLWAFNVQKSNFQIPVFLTIQASDVISVILGLNRSMMHSQVSDATLALFRYRQSSSNGTITREENFGERYTIPTEEVSDVRTTFLAGVTAAPSSSFRVRLLVVPNFRDTYEGSKFESLQWWISMNIIP